MLRLGKKLCKQGVPYKEPQKTAGFALCKRDIPFFCSQQMDVLGYLPQKNSFVVRMTPDLLCLSANTCDAIRCKRRFANTEESANGNLTPEYIWKAMSFFENADLRFLAAQTKGQEVSSSITGNKPGFCAGKFVGGKRRLPTRPFNCRR